MATIGGLLLILGAVFTFYGHINKSIVTYFFADAMWVGISFSTGDYIGTALVTIGMSLGIGTYIKMNRGYLRKTLLI